VSEEPVPSTSCRTVCPASRQHFCSRKPGHFGPHSTTTKPHGCHEIMVQWDDARPHYAGERPFPPPARPFEARLREAAAEEKRIQQDLEAAFVFGDLAERCPSVDPVHAFRCMLLPGHESAHRAKVESTPEGEFVWSDEIPTAGAEPYETHTLPSCDFHDDCGLANQASVTTTGRPTIHSWNRAECPRNYCDAAYCADECAERAPTVEAARQELLRPSSEWVKHSPRWLEGFPGMVIREPDGWDRENFAASWAEPITEEEFYRRAMLSSLAPAAASPPPVHSITEAGRIRKSILVVRSLPTGAYRAIEPMPTDATIISGPHWSSLGDRGYLMVEYGKPQPVLTESPSVWPTPQCVEVAPNGRRCELPNEHKGMHQASATSFVGRVLPRCVGPGDWECPKGCGWSEDAHEQCGECPTSVEATWPRHDDEGHRVNVPGEPTPDCPPSERGLGVCSTPDDQYLPARDPAEAVAAGPGEQECGNKHLGARIYCRQPRGHEGACWRTYLDEVNRKAEARKTQQAPYLLKTTDAAVWADEFLRVAARTGPIDRTMMIGWFANAFFAQECASSRNEVSELLKLASEEMLNIHVRRDATAWVTNPDGKVWETSGHLLVLRTALGNEAEFRWPGDFEPLPEPEEQEAAASDLRSRPKREPLGMECDHQGGAEYHCAECCPPEGCAMHPSPAPAGETSGVAIKLVKDAPSIAATPEQIAAWLKIPLAIRRCISPASIKVPIDTSDEFQPPLTADDEAWLQSVAVRDIHEKVSEAYEIVEVLRKQASLSVWTSEQLTTAGEALVLAMNGLGLLAEAATAKPDPDAYTEAEVAERYADRPASPITTAYCEFTKPDQVTIGVDRSFAVQAVSENLAQAVTVALNDGRQHTVTFGPWEVRPHPTCPDVREVLRRSVAILVSRLEDVQVGEWVPLGALNPVSREYPVVTTYGRFECREFPWGDGVFACWERTQ
jgi:hypothetical protein